MTRSTPLDDFLTDAPSSAAATRLETIGLAISLPTLMVSIGLIAYLAFVHRGERREVTALVRVTIVAAIAAGFGAVIEVLGASELFEISWADAFADGTAAAPMMRVMAAIMIALGLYDHTIPVHGQDAIPDSGSPSDRNDIGHHGLADDLADDHDDDHDHDHDDDHDHDHDDDHDGHDGQVVRWVPSAASAFALVGVAIAVLSFAFDGHTVDATPRVLVALLDACHVTAGAIWLGGVVGLIVVAQCFRRGTGSIATLLIRFSGVAALSLQTVAIAGALMSWAIVDGFDDYTSTEWGQRLIAKVVLVSLAAACGAYNHFFVVPRLDPPAPITGEPPATSTAASAAAVPEIMSTPERMARRVLVVEALAFVGVLAITVILVQASTV